MTKEKDTIRQENIIKLLNPKKFWRYNLETKTFKNVIGGSDAEWIRRKKWAY